MAQKLQLRAENTRRRILETAIEKFSSGGFTGTVIDDIAGSAGVNKQRIYAYFGSKQKLFDAALLEVFSRVKLLSAAAVSRAAKAPEDLTAIVLEEFLRVHQENPALWRLLAWANLQSSTSVEALAGVRHEENSALRKIFEVAVGQGAIKDVKFENWLFTLLAVSCFYFSNSRTMQYTFAAEIVEPAWKNAFIEDMKRLFLPR